MQCDVWEFISEETMDPLAVYRRQQAVPEPNVRAERERLRFSQMADSVEALVIMSRFSRWLGMRVRQLSPGYTASRIANVRRMFASVCLDRAVSMLMGESADGTLSPPLANAAIDQMRMLDKFLGEMVNIRSGNVAAYINNLDIFRDNFGFLARQVEKDRATKKWVIPVPRVPETLEEILGQLCSAHCAESGSFY